jgi:anti-sigma regulatory factor (Ser/Thr protein kinase)
MCSTTEAAELLLPDSLQAPAVARGFALHSRCTDHAGKVLDEALLLISELVTNSLLYAAPPILLSIECDGSGIHVRVRDNTPALPKQRGPARDDEGGRGLPLVEQLADTWGVEAVADQHGLGKAVWFELRTEPASPP